MDRDPSYMSLVYEYAGLASGKDTFHKHRFMTVFFPHIIKVHITKSLRNKFYEKLIT